MPLWRSRAFAVLADSCEAKPANLGRKTERFEPRWQPFFCSDESRDVAQNLAGRICDVNARTSEEAYFDHAATTPMRPEALDAMTRVLANDFGNPSGVHLRARDARALLEDARDRFAAVVGASPHEVVFTGCGTESINLAMRSVSVSSVAASAIEHDAVRETAAAMGRAGVRLTELRVDSDGVLEISALLVSGADLVAVMAVNNEVGTLQPVLDVANHCKASGSLLLVDAVQALSWIDVRPIVGVADFVAFSAHKFGGPKGVGALIVRGGRRIEPLLYGGGQEQERRSGTQNVAGIVAMATAAEITDRNRNADSARIGRLRDRLVDGLVGRIDGCTETVPRNVKVAGSAHVCIEGISSEELLVLLDREGVYASAGSACASGALHVSPVLLAMGVSKERALGSLRLSLGVTSTDTDVEHALAAVPGVVARLRGG